MDGGMLRAPWVEQKITGHFGSYPLVNVAIDIPLFLEDFPTILGDEGFPIATSNWNRVD